MRVNPVRITPTLAASVGLLVFIAVGIVLYIQWSASKKILADLGGRLVVRNMEIVTQGIKSHLDPVRSQIGYLADIIESDDFDVSDRRRLSDLLTGSVAASPQIEAVGVLGLNKTVTRIRWQKATDRYEVETVDYGDRPDLLAMLEEGRTHRVGYWGDLAYSPELKHTYINFRHPLFKEGKYFGLIGAAVTIENFSQLADDMGRLFGNTTFILSGKDRVLAHPSLLSGDHARSATEPAVSFDQVGDPVLSAMDRAVPSSLVDIRERQDLRLFDLKVGGVDYFLMRGSLKGYGEPPLLIGTYRKSAEVDQPLRVLYLSGLVGLVLLAMSLVGAIWLSRIMTRPMRRVTEGVAQIGELDLTDIKLVGASWIREVDDLSKSFNGMVGSLRFFETYVPRKLVKRLISHGTDAKVESEERELTVMFTDIAGFTSMCEGMNAREVAAFINDHLTILAECVEAEGGTVDKYIGDALMAFWGAPEQQENTAIAACRAAQAMSRAIRDDNKQRVAAGKEPVGVRIGIHTGPLVVGNIGAPSRINYTVVGDTVNTTQRLESLGKEVDPDADVMVLMSACTNKLLSGDFETEPAGSFKVKGKEEEVNVCRLLI